MSGSQTEEADSSLSLASLPHMLIMEIHHRVSHCGRVALLPAQSAFPAAALGGFASLPLGKSA